MSVTELHRQAVLTALRNAALYAVQEDADAVIAELLQLGWTPPSAAWLTTSKF